MSDVVTYEAANGVATITFDDGKANVVNHALVDGVNAGLDQAEADGLGVLLVGRAGMFSAGFDLGVVRDGGREAGRALVDAGARLALRIGRFPRPVSVACTGHGLAMGAVLLCAADHRIGAEGDFKIGFNEVAIGMATPGFLLELARERLSKRHLLAATGASRIYSPSEAVDVGLLDETSPADELLAAAKAHAEQLAALPAPAFAKTKAMTRGSVMDIVEASLA